MGRRVREGISVERHSTEMCGSLRCYVFPVVIQDTQTRMAMQVSGFWFAVYGLWFVVACFSETRNNKPQP